MRTETATPTLPARPDRPKSFHKHSNSFSAQVGAGLVCSHDTPHTALLTSMQAPTCPFPHQHPTTAPPQLDTQWRAFQVAMLKPAPAVEALETGRSGRTSGTTDEGEPFLTMEDLRPSAATSQWLVVGITLLPKVSW